jgi:hypothetical protein
MTMTTKNDTPTITSAERRERLDGPIHTWFSLSYSNYLVLHRSMMQSMPVDWQERAVALFGELNEAFDGVEQAPSYIVTAATESTYSDLSGADMAALGVTCERNNPVLPGDLDDVYHDRDSTEHGPHDRVFVPLGDDPVPHYDRGRTFIEGVR